jgi:hypothetical protein
MKDYNCEQCEIEYFINKLDRAVDNASAWIRIARKLEEELSWVTMWRPIRSAPRDGRRFLFTNGNIVGTAFYLNGEHFCADSWQGEKDTTPTHWMPRPDLPEEEENAI